MFIPYRAKIKVTRTPWAAIIISVLCILTTWAQQNNANDIEYAISDFCVGERGSVIERIERQYMGWESQCDDVIAYIYLNDADRRQQDLNEYVTKIRETPGGEYDAEQFLAYFNKFSQNAPRYLTAGLWEEVGTWNPLRMLSGSLAHADWDHLIGNLFFFMAFAMVVETVLGPVLFFAMCMVMAWGIGSIESLFHFGEAQPTLGLSGVVMGVMTLAAYFAPKVRINFFYVFFIYIGVLSIPLWLVVGWYVGWDLYNNVVHHGEFNIGFAAHLAGAAMGLLLGVSLFRDRRQWLQERIVVQEFDLTQEQEPWLQKLNALMTAPVIAGLWFFGFVLAVVLLIKFITTFAVQILMAAPMVAALYQLYRMKHAARPDWQRYQEAMAQLQDSNYKQAVAKFRELAEGGYSKAQYQLARLIQTGKGVFRDPKEAASWLQRAAAVGHAQAQHALGTCYADGRGVDLDRDEAIAWYEKAMHKGLAEAAMSLGYSIENHPNKDLRDPDRIADAYARAMDLYLKQGDTQSAEAARKSLAAVKPGDAK